MSLNLGSLLAHLARNEPTGRVGVFFEKEVDNPWWIGSVGLVILTMIDAIDLLSVKQTK